jgi:glycosyltransferase involved in cell wall biosynthesis
MGIDETFIECGKDRKKRANGHPVTILSNRNLLPIYDVSCLIRAIPLILKEEREVRFLIAGEGAERDNLEREAQQFNIGSSLQFLGRVAHVQMADLLAQTDVYVSTSLSDGTSVSLMEALAAGAFPVVTDIPANREWITDGKNGFLVPAGNERKLADRIIEAIRNPEFVERAGKMNQNVVREKAHWEANIGKMTQIYMDSLRV